MRILLAGGVFRLSESERSRRQPAPETTLAGGLRQRSVEVITMPLERFGSVAFSRGFDAVHVHHLSKAAVAAALSPMAAPFIFTPHGTSTAERWPERAGLTAVMSRMDAGVCLSTAELNWRANAFPEAREKLVVIPNGIRPLGAKPIHRAWPSGDPFRMLFVGQLIPLKRVHWILEALVQIRDAECTLVFHNDEQLADLTQRAVGLGVAGRVTFLGQRSGDQLRDAYEQAHVLVLPSEAEALPSVVTEALMSGLPVVASDVGGVAGQVKQAGLVVDSRTQPALTDGLLSLRAAYPAYARATHERAWEMIEEYSIDRMVERHVRLYEKVAGQ